MFIHPKYHVIPAVIFAGLLTACSDSKQNDNADTIVHNVFLTTPEAVDGSTVRTFAGQVEEARTISAAFRTGGTIERILVKEGDRVRRGQLLAVLDSADYVLGTGQLRVQYEQLKSEFARLSKLYASGGVSDNDYEKAKTGLLQLGYQLALNENKIDYCKLISPSDAVVTAVNYEVGEQTDAGRAVFDLMDNSHLEVVVDLPVNEYLKHNDFNTFIGSNPILPGESFPLRLLSLTPLADNNQLYRMKLALASADNVVLTPGMNVNVTITTSGDASGVVSIPVSSVFDHNGRTAVYVFNPTDSTVIATPVAISGTGTDGTVTVTSGLTPSQSIVRAGVNHLVSGEKVKVIAPASDYNIGNIL